VEEPNTRVLIPGIAVAGGSYLLCVIWAGAVSSGFPLIPLAGPFIEAGRAGSFTSGDFTLALLASLGQGIGATLITIGLLKPRQWLEPEVTGPSMSVLPMAPGAQAGASVVGRF
jgi:hypothetical protein